MGLASIQKDLAVKLEQKNNSLFDYPVEKQKKYLEHFKEPRDNIERAHFQYRCQMKMNNLLVSFALNLASLPLILFYLNRKDDKLEGVDKTDSVFFADGKPENIIPDELREQVGEILVINEKRERLTKEDKAFFSKLWKRYPFSWQFLLKCLMKIRYYSYEIQRAKPRCIIVCNEYSFTSSAMTAYCEERGIHHINVMHGEKLYFMRDSFFRFNECYVWDDYYVQLFSKLRAEKTQFRIALPMAIKFETAGCVKATDYTYYLGAEKGEKLRIIIKAMDQLRKKGMRVAIRPHPRYSDIEEILRTAPDLYVENTALLSIEESLSSTENAVSLYSTVLNQAYNNGIGIVIDDISDPKRFQSLKELEYILIEKEHGLLSEVLEENQ